SMKETTHQKLLQFLQDSGKLLFQIQPNQVERNESKETLDLLQTNKHLRVRDYLRVIQLATCLNILQEVVAPSHLLIPTTLDGNKPLLTPKFSIQPQDLLQAMELLELPCYR